MQYDQSVPAYLRDDSFVDGQDAFTGGIVGARGPHITFRNGRFILVDSAGVEKLVETFHIDVILVDAAAGLSKLYFPNAYTPNSAEPPTCFSNDSKFPDANSQEVQARSCAECQWNVFGSITTQQGKPAKACMDRKRLAVLYLYDLQGPLYELSISPVNLRPWNEYVQQLVGRGLPPRGLVTRISANPQQQGGLAFQPAVSPQGAGLWFVPEQVKALITTARQSEQCKRAIGADARPAPPMLNAPAPQPQVQYQPQTGAGPLPQAYSTLTAPVQPAATPAPVDPFASAQPAGGAVPTASATDKPPRHRRTKAEMEAARAAAANPPQGVAQPSSNALPAGFATGPSFGQAHEAGPAPVAAMASDPFAMSASAGNGNFGIVTAAEAAGVPPELDAMLAQVLKPTQ